MNAQVAIVIITKDTKELLENLLKSIEKDHSLQPFIDKIIVIDNASVDGTDQVIRGKFPAVVYTRNEKNMGFAFSVNKGASFAENKYVLFLNSDTILIEGELERMVRFMDGNSDVAICGPQLVYPDMSPQRSFAAAPSLWGEFFPQKRFKVRKLNEDDSRSSSSIHNSQFTIHNFLEVDSLIGAAILVRRDILKALDGFDERFFFFLEETDLCVRARQAGYRVVHFPETRIIHLQGKTVRKSWINGRIEYNISLIKFIKKHHMLGYYNIFVVVRFIKALFLGMFFPLLFFGRRLRIKYAYYLRLIFWYFRGCPDNAGLRSKKS
jgi:GT2 family glycosyltransferase